MPLHDFRCELGHTTEVYVAHGVDEIRCPVCMECTPECKAGHHAGYEVIHVGYMAKKVFLQAPIGRVVNIEYTSPIDGRPITTKAQRIEDLARNGCVEYDPEMKTDYMRRQQESERELDGKLDSIVESEIHSMGARKREKLEAEFRNGADIDFARSTLEG